MSAKGKQHDEGDRPTDGWRSRRRFLLWVPAIGLIVALVVIATALVVILRDEDSPGKTGNTGGGAAAPSAGQYTRLVGRWVRPDGEYVLEIRGVNADGKLDAAYLNPRPINVSKAQASMEGGKVAVFVELRDQGYPGSFYRLTYDAAGDQMTGLYHQAAMGQDYEVAFVRLRE